eukprot:6180658-Pleurochrysis_carterae.AAC.2
MSLLVCRQADDALRTFSASRVDQGSGAPQALKGFGIKAGDLGDLGESGELGDRDWVVEREVPPCFAESVR